MCPVSVRHRAGGPGNPRDPGLAPGGSRCHPGAIGTYGVGSSSGSSLRELMPSLVNTFRRCHSTVRGLMNSCAPISEFRSLERGESGDLSLLGGELRSILARPKSSRCPLEEGSGRRDPAAGMGARGRAFEPGGDLLVPPDARLRAVPRPAVGVKIGHVCQGAVHPLQVVHVGRTPGGRAHQRMMEPHTSTELDQSSCLGQGRGIGPDPEPLDRAPQYGHVADRLDGRREEEQIWSRGKGLKSSKEPLFHTAGERRRVGEPESERQLCRRSAARQLQQRQRVPASLGDDLVASRGPRSAPRNSARESASFGR